MLFGYSSPSKINRWQIQTDRKHLCRVRRRSCQIWVLGINVSVIFRWGLHENKKS